MGNMCSFQSFSSQCHYLVSFSLVPPDVVLFPTTAQEVSECAKVCHSHRVPIIPFGTGTGLEGGISAVQVRVISHIYHCPAF